MPVAAQTDTSPLTDWRLWWFALLEAALERGNRAAATKAIQNLKRLGVEVRFILPPVGREARRGR